MGQSKEMFTELQNEAATRSNPEFMHYVQMAKNSPSPADFADAAYNGISAMLDELELPAFKKTVLMGMVSSFGESVRLDAIDGMSNKPAFPQSEHVLMLIENGIS